MLTGRHRTEILRRPTGAQQSLANLQDVAFLSRLRQLYRRLPVPTSVQFTWVHVSIDSSGRHVWPVGVAARLLCKCASISIVRLAA